MAKLARYREVLQVLVKYGFEDVVTQKPFKSFIPKWKALIPNRKGRPVTEYSRYERIRLVMEELGPTYIKFGQLLSNRADLLPEDMIIEFERLQEQAPKLPMDQVYEILEEEYGRPVNEVFNNFDPEPLASASMAQVHRAEILNGQPVILKIQRPNIRQKIKDDMAIMRDLAKVIIRRYPEAATLQPLELLKSFEESIKNELNFHKEGLSIQRFHRNFKNNEDIYVPEYYPEYSTPRVLCMEYVDGIKISDTEKLRGINIDMQEVACRGTDVYFQQVFDHGFFHADPHPGNLYVLKNGKICYLDFGMMGTLMPKERELLGDMLIYIDQKNVKRLSHTIQKIALINQVDNHLAFERDLYNLIEDYYTSSLGDIQISEIIERFRKLLNDHDIPIPANFYLLLRSLMIVEGVGYSLYPDYDIISQLRPYAEKLFMSKFNPKKVLGNLFNAYEDVSILLSGLPSDAKKILNMVKKGQLHIQFEHQGLEPFYKNLDMVSNRISIAIVLAAMIIGSALIVHAGIPPRVFNIPVIGFIGFVISAILAIWLVVSLLRHGKW